MAIFKGSRNIGSFDDSNVIKIKKIIMATEHFCRYVKNRNKFRSRKNIVAVRAGIYDELSVCGVGQFAVVSIPRIPGKGFRKIQYDRYTGWRGGDLAFVSSGGAAFKIIEKEITKNKYTGGKAGTDILLSKSFLETIRKKI